MLLSPPSPLFLGLPQSSLPAGTPQFPLLPSLLQRCFRPAAGQRPVYSLCLSAPFSRETASLSQQALSGLPDPITRTAVVFICVDSFIRYWQAEPMMLTLSVNLTLTRSLSNSQFGPQPQRPITGWLLRQQRLSNPGGVRWSPHLLPVYPTHHSDSKSCTSAKLLRCIGDHSDSKSLSLLNSWH